MKRDKLLQVGMSLLLALCLSPLAQAQQPVADKEYKLINPPQPNTTGKKVEVIEFFSYACPHCAEFEPALQDWLKRKPKDVEYKMVPMVFRDAWKPTAKLYYTLEAMGLVDKYHGKVYESTLKNKDLSTDQAVKDWAKDAGIDVAKFNQVYDSFGIDAKVQRSMTAGRAYGVQFTPSLAINGKYYTGPSMVGGGHGTDYKRFFGVVDQLIEMERKKKG
jgi:thiol:disulfide interchange protein DsbA